jgi:uncharacterized repeat protein (TIGR03843 family)
METTLDEVLSILSQGEFTVKGEFLWGSNYTFLAQVDRDGHMLQAVYKPIRGERPLWDFPASSLARREVAAFLVSEALGWNFVPATVYRKNGPLGSGSLQLYIDHDPEYHYFNFSTEDRQRLRPVVLFDMLINNADRKGSHVLRGEDNHLWLIDHGVCFHVEDKLRTVIWDFVGEPVPETLCSDLWGFREKLIPSNGKPSALTEKLLKYINQHEIKALIKRAERLTEIGVFPPPDPGRRAFPWPQV